MNVFFDCRYVRWTTHDGVSRYSVGVVTALAKLTAVTMLINDERQLTQLPDVPWVKVPAAADLREVAMARYLNRLHPDVVVSPMQTMSSIGRNFPLVLTVHDLIYYRHRTPPPDLPLWLRLLWRTYHLMWWPQKVLLNRADAVAVVSETTRALVLKHALTRRPLILAPNASSLVPGPGFEPIPHAQRTPNLVYMGSFMPYKNVELLVRAMDELPGYRLHLLSPIAPEVRDRLEELGVSGTALIFHEGVSDDEYVSLLTNATALVTASFDEGFGIPLVEALALGTPVIVSDIDIFREVAGEAGTYFDPRDRGGFVTAVRTLESEERWSELSAESVDQAARWNWTRSARQLFDGLTELLEKR
ncbi:mannosyltransferase [Marisediminicola antarctica]|uniref:Mannosyltransferase n=1 Tax=Marisediminicola antarctica TaxID=674079 RepID=A0A7L5AKK1_9MICO|nr:glycosyltransferase family 1 protein [Marisediminicola antarctica]QHO70602.1 mannosyltransferase [Marisediminicola antarctica]